MSRPKFLGVLLCYNDGDLLEESITYLLDQHHDLIVWDHGSTDETAAVIQRFRGDLVETQYIPREFDFYELYPTMSRHLMENWTRHYDWISWPDQDEFLGGPSRERPYWQWLEELHESHCDWVRFDNFNYWFTSADTADCPSVVQRVRHYCLFPQCAPRNRCWRASSTNVRVFNHNAPRGTPCTIRFELRHYPIRSAAQMRARVLRDRAGLRRGQMNYHYENMKAHLDRIDIRPDQLHYDDGYSELNRKPIFNWLSVYGS